MRKFFFRAVLVVEFRDFQKSELLWQNKVYFAKKMLKSIDFLPVFSKFNSLQGKKIKK